MDNHGQLYAHDKDLRRLAPLHERAQRAGVRNLQIRAPRGRHDVMRDFAGRADLVLVDAPCSGSGTWRRNPDAKWRLRPNALAERCAEQDAALADGARLVRPGGRLVYVTCSLLTEENDDRLAAFRAANADFTPIAPAELALTAGLTGLLGKARVGAASILMTPLRTGTDGFFVAALRRTG
jgi:16S rRNA (cytosine967-C5)-methyltransferase